MQIREEKSEDYRTV